MTTASPRVRQLSRFGPWLRLAGLLVAGVTTGGFAMAVEEPKFELIAQDGSREIRRYAPLIVAETLVSGDMDAASGKGFRLIADYIFGNNTRAGEAAEKASQKIAMTAPVVLEPVAASQKIAMTAPVTAEPLDAALDLASATQWRIQFVMPAEYAMPALPKPNNEAVTLRQLPARTFAVLTYSGLNSASRIHEKTAELSAWLNARGAEPMCGPLLARYDPPWTLPMWRRNEIQIELKLP